MKTSQLIEQFNAQAYSTSWRPTPIGNLRVNKILSLVGTNKRVLDVGCYDGTIAKRIQSQNNQVLGVDISANAVKLARANGITASVCNIEEQDLPSQANNLDVVVAGEIIEHIFDPDNFLLRLRTRLVPGGHLILTTPNLAGLGSRLSLLFGKLPWMIENDLYPGKSGHIRYYTFAELKNKLAQNGFQVTNFVTDSVGINTLTIPFIDRLFPTLGRILIVKAKKV